MNPGFGPAIPPNGFWDPVVGNQVWDVVGLVHRVSTRETVDHCGPAVHGILGLHGVGRARMDESPVWMMMEMNEDA